MSKWRYVQNGAVFIIDPRGPVKERPIPAGAVRPSFVRGLADADAGAGGLIFWTGIRHGVDALRQREAAPDIIGRRILAIASGP